MFGKICYIRSRTFWFCLQRPGNLLRKLLLFSLLPENNHLNQDNGICPEFNQLRFGNSAGAISDFNTNMSCWSLHWHIGQYQHKVIQFINSKCHGDENPKIYEEYINTVKTHWFNNKHHKTTNTYRRSVQGPDKKCGLWLLAVISRLSGKSTPKDINAVLTIV